MKRRLIILFLILLCFSSAAAAEDLLDVTLAHGERWTVPADRAGECTISDPEVVSYENGQLTGLRPGRAEVRMDGYVPTVFRVLVLFAETDEAEAVPAPEQHTDVRLYAVSDGDEAEDEVEPPLDEADYEALQPDAEAEPTQEPEAAETENGPLEAASEADAPTAQVSGDPSQQSYDRSAVPEAINTVIDFALNEWREADNKTFSRAGSKNKYSFWQCGKGPKCNIGWCGAFLGYVFDTCGIPMDEPTKSVPHDSGEPYSVRAAGVGKINKGFEKMERLSMVPQPGYLVVYGEQRGYGYKHIGLLTDVDDLGEGVYLLKTVEGNMSSRIKRYCYLFDSNEKVKNTKACPEEYVLKDGGINDYQHIKNWNITTFCQTWY